MYPRISDLTRDLFGFEFPIPLYSFGLMVAVAILVATELTRREVDRLYAVGRLPAATISEKNKKGRTVTREVSPSTLVWILMIMAAVLGITGSKLFHIIDYWDTFVQDPAGMLFSSSGLTFYGGLICATLGMAYYIRRRGQPFFQWADAAAPGLILAYGIGRIGCYLAGDGDWGTCSRLEDKPGWLPDWLWSETFPNNYLGVDVKAFVEDRGATCVEGADGVYPTMLYEFAMCAVLFGVLWLLRTHPFKAGWLFSLYLVFNGAERFLIEFIRINPVNAGIFSQSQLIAMALFVFGVIGLAVFTRRRDPAKLEAVPTD
ncbi:MAG: prolipoprotein diacylglyceryl transferase family protein [Bacteroidota bacterium]